MKQLCAVVLVGGFLVAFNVAAIGNPVHEVGDVFVAKQGGYQSYRIPCLVATKQGTLLAFCEARQARDDWGPIDIMLRRSTDGGHTWSEQRKVAQVPGPHSKNPVAVKQNLGKSDEVTYNNPVPIVDQKTGAIHLLFCLEYMRAFYQRSDDDGQTFSEPVEITAAFEPFRKDYDWKVLATGPGHGVQLASGRLVVPVWLSTGTGGHAHRPSVISTIYSDDHGKSWQRGEIITGETDPLVNPSESTAVQLADGRVMLNIRCESKANRRAVSFSPDGATGWTRPEFQEQLAEPICMASLCRLSTGGRGENRLLFVNPDNLERSDGKAEPGKSRDRRNLTVRVSYDEGQTWPVKRSLEKGPSGYSDLTVAPDGTIYCLYERGSHVDNAFLPSLKLARFNCEWLTEKY